MRRLLLCLAIAAPAALPQLFTAGIKAGVPLTDALETGTGAFSNFTSDNRKYTIGPTIEMNLPFGLGVEFDALYKRLGYDETLTGPPELHRTVTANAWDFPVLLKVKTGMQPIRPYFVIGPTFRGLTNLKQAGDFFQLSTSDPEEVQRHFNTGLTAGVGLRLGGRVAFSPEVRYTRWGWDDIRDVSGLIHSNKDQVELLIGLTF